MKKLIHTILCGWLLVLAPACTGRTGPPQVVKVPVPVACEIEQVPPAELPKASPEAGIFDLAKTAIAKLKLLAAENERLRAANSSPCPAE